MDLNKLNKVIRSISEKTKNRELLEKILKECGMSRSNCSNLMVYNRGSSFDHYVYRYKEEQFPREFSYLFLNAAFSSLYLKNLKKVRNKKKSLEYVKKNKDRLWYDQSKNFYEIISNCRNQDIKNKLIIPALELHALNLIRLGNMDQNNNYNENYVENYLRISFSEAFNYIEESDQENLQDELPTKKFIQYEKLIQNLKNFYPIIERLRKIFMKEFLAPDDYKKIKVVTPTLIGSGNYEDMLFSKSFLRDELKISDINNLFMLVIDDENMKGSFEVNDKVLILEHPSYRSLKENKPLKNSSYRFKDGVYAIKIPDFSKKNKLGEKFAVRRLQFNYTYQGDYEIPEFLQEEAEKDINKVFAKGIDKVSLFQVDELVQKYGIGNPLLVEKLKPIINLEESQEDFYFGKKVQKDKNQKVMVSIISDNQKYRPITVNIDALTIVGKVKWKSSFANELLENNDFRTKNNFYEPMDKNDLFEEKEIPEFDLFFDQNKKEIA